MINGTERLKEILTKKKQQKNPKKTAQILKIQIMCENRV